MSITLHCYLLTECLATTSCLYLNIVDSLAVLSKTRRNFLKCLKEQKMKKSFYYLKKQRTSVSLSCVIEVQVYYYCRCPDDGSKIVACDGECGN